MKLNVVVGETHATVTSPDSLAYVEFSRIFNKAWMVEKVHGFTKLEDVAEYFAEAIKHQEIECFILGEPATSVINKKSNIMKVLLEEKPIEL